LAGRNIDALKFGNVARFINHSCEPNLILQVRPFGPPTMALIWR
jgi:hypothetical protein